MVVDWSIWRPVCLPGSFVDAISKTFHATICSLLMFQLWVLHFLNNSDIMSKTSLL